MDQPFDRIAPRYDFTNDLMSAGFHRLWKRRLLKKFAQNHSLDHSLNQGLHLLDVATGTGELANRLGRKFSNLKITGIDPSLPMMEVGQRAGRKLDKWVVGSSESLPFPAEHFDVLTCAYGVRNFQDRPRAFKEWARVLKPGGRAYVLEIHKPTQKNVARLWSFLMPKVAGLFNDQSDYVYLAKSTENFPSARQMGDEIVLAGFRLDSLDSLWISEMLSLSVYERKA